LSAATAPRIPLLTQDRRHCSRQIDFTGSGYMRRNNNGAIWLMHIPARTNGAPSRSTTRSSLLRRIVARVRSGLAVT